tara:strand:+ start:224484 stop:225230 length:747 start_codon:yes stop_codon:yes gene_type:complete
MKKRLCTLLLPLSLLLGTPNSARAATVEYSAGHADIGLAYEGGELELHYHFGDGAILDGVPVVSMDGMGLEYAPDEAHVLVPDDARIVTTDPVPFLGTRTGDPIWRLTQGNTPGLPFLGIAAEELDSMIFSNATIQMTSFNGPGEFALWQPGALGGTTEYWRTNDGIDASDAVTVGIGGHDHYFYGFTAEGIYDVGLTAEAEFAAGGSVTDMGVIRFVVGSATAVPEPSSFAVLCIGGTVLAARRRRR